MLKRFILVFFLILSFFNLTNSSIYASFGVSPADFTFERLLPGMEYEKEYLLSRTDLDEDLNVVIEVDVPGANEWINIDPGFSFTIPKGQQTKNLNILVKVPEDAALKEYKGYVTLKVSPNGKTAGVSVVGGVAISVNLTTTNNEVRNLLVRNLEIQNVLVGEPITLVLTIENLGNKWVAPDKVKIVVDDSLNNKVLESEKVGLAKVVPGKVEELPISFDNDLSKGEYFANIQVLFDGKKIKEDKLIFLINEKDIIDQIKAVNKPLRINIILFILGLFILLVTLIIILRKLLNKMIF